METEDVWRLSRGKSTKENIGSRAIPHRLTKDEEARVRRALDKGFLEVYSSSRNNIYNIYSKLCTAMGKPIIVIEHSETTSVGRVDEQEVHFSSRSDAKQWAKSIAKTS